MDNQSHTPFNSKLWRFFFLILKALLIPSSFSSKTEGSLDSCHRIAMLGYFNKASWMKWGIFGAFTRTFWRSPSLRWNLDDHGRNGSIKALQYVAIETEKIHLSRCVLLLRVLRQIYVYWFIAHFEHVSEEQLTFEAFTCSSEECMLFFQLWLSFVMLSGKCFILKANLCYTQFNMLR